MSKQVFLILVLLLSCGLALPGCVDKQKERPYTEKKSKPKPLRFLIFSLQAKSNRSGVDTVGNLCRVAGEDEHGLIGEGLVVGLNGTGDKDKQTAKAIAKYIKRTGNAVDKNDIKPKNIAMVYITATVRPYTKKGKKITISVTPLFSATSLQQGRLLPANLFGPHWGKSEEDVYAKASGQVMVDAEHPTKGTIISGAVMVKEIKSSFYDKEEKLIRFILKDPNPETASEIVEKINKEMPGLFKIKKNAVLAEAPHPAIVDVNIPDSVQQKDLVKFHSFLLNISVSVPSQPVVSIFVRNRVITIEGRVRIPTVMFGMVHKGKQAGKDKTSLYDLLVYLKKTGMGFKEIAKLIIGLHRTGQLKADLVIDGELDELESMKYFIKDSREYRKK